MSSTGAGHWGTENPGKLLWHTDIKNWRGMINTWGEVIRKWEWWMRWGVSRECRIHSLLYYLAPCPCGSLRTCCRNHCHMKLAEAEWRQPECTRGSERVATSLHSPWLPSKTLTTSRKLSPRRILLPVYYVVNRFNTGSCTCCVSGIQTTRWCSRASWLAYYWETYNIVGVFDTGQFGIKYVNIFGII